MRYPNIPEEELKSKVAQDYFSAYDFATIVGKVDFCVMPKRSPSMLFQDQSLLWAEAKANKHDVVAMFVQLILTIGRARTFDKNLPPAFLGAFDAEKIAFVPYDKVHHLFFQNDFNWNVAPSDHGTKEFAEIKSLITSILDSEKHLYIFGKDDTDLRFFRECSDSIFLLSLSKKTWKFYAKNAVVPTTLKVANQAKNNVTNVVHVAVILSKATLELK